MRRPLVELVRRLAKELPPAMLATLADAIAKADPAWRANSTTISGCLPQPHYRSLAADLLRAWEAEDPEVSPGAVALALTTAGEMERHHREGQSVELVWTGPDAQAMPLRQTEQALLQVIDLARERLLVVSYAVYRIPRVCDALVRAADRGVSLRIVVEASDEHGGRSIRAKLYALGESVARRAAVYYWPADRRPRDEQGGQGVLHAKCAVADGRWLFLSSANLTENAFSLNVELGLLVGGGPMAGQAEARFQRLIETGILAEV